MGKYLTAALLIALATNVAYSNGVAIKDAHNGIYLTLDSTFVRVSVQGQISVATTTQYFTNHDSAGTVKYGFPLSESASAIQLRWLLHGEWKTASVSGHSQDTTLPPDFSECIFR